MVMTQKRLDASMLIFVEKQVAIEIDTDVIEK